MARRHPAFARAAALREEFRQRGEGEFTQAAFRQALHDVLFPWQHDAYNGFVEHVADVIDKDAAREPSTAEPTQGLFWDLGGEYHLTAGRRIAKSRAQLQHMEEMIMNDEQNLAAVLDASRRKHEELARLRPYFQRRPGMTKQEAVAAYVADHEGDTP